jgi:hypothetical protein
MSTVTLPSFNNLLGFDFTTPKVLVLDGIRFRTGIFDDHAKVKQRIYSLMALLSDDDVKLMRESGIEFLIHDSFTKAKHHGDVSAHYAQSTIVLTIDPKFIALEAMFKGKRRAAAISAQIEVLVNLDLYTKEAIDSPTRNKLLLESVATAYLKHGLITNKEKFIAARTISVNVMGCIESGVKLAGSVVSFFRK